MNNPAIALNALSELSPNLSQNEKRALQKVVTMGLKGYTCAQIIYQLIVQDRPDQTRDAAVTRALGIFNRGIASYGELCGIVIGGAAALSSLSPEVIKSEDDPVWRVAQYFLEEFETEITSSFTTMHCSTIRSQSARKGKNNTAVCAVLLARAVTALKHHIEQSQMKSGI